MKRTLFAVALTGFLAVLLWGDPDVMKADGWWTEAEDTTHTGVFVASARASGDGVVVFDLSTGGSLSFTVPSVPDPCGILEFYYECQEGAVEADIYVNSILQGSVLFPQAASGSKVAATGLALVTSDVVNVVFTAAVASCSLDMMYLAVEDPGLCKAEMNGKDSASQGDLKPGDFMDDDHQSIEGSSGGGPDWRIRSNAGPHRG